MKKEMKIENEKEKLNYVTEQTLGFFLFVVFFLSSVGLATARFK
jgi:hypothetical protein